MSASSGETSRYFSRALAQNNSVYGLVDHVAARASREAAVAAQVAAPGACFLAVPDLEERLLVDVAQRHVVAARIGNDLAVGHDLGDEPGADARDAAHEFQRLLVIGRQLLLGEHRHEIDPRVAAGLHALNLLPQDVDVHSSRLNFVAEAIDGRGVLLAPLE